jgi:hypothetical protein
MRVAATGLQAIAYAGLLWLAASSAPLFGVDEKTVDACEVFRNPDAFSGKTLRIRGVLVQHVEGASLLGYPRCEGVPFHAAALHIVTPDARSTWRKGGGFIGVWLLCDMTGRFDRNSNGGFEFYLESLTAIRKVKPYDVSARR